MERATVPPARVDDEVGTAAHLAVADQVAAAAATLVRPGSGAIPLPPGPIAVASVTDDATGIPEPLAVALREAGRDASAVPRDRLDAVGAGSAVLVLGGRGGRGAGGAAGPALDLSRLSVPVAAVSVGVPYPLARFPQNVGCVAVYGADPPSLRAAARVLAGTLEARGRLPVTLGEPGEPRPQTLGKT